MTKRKIIVIGGGHAGCEAALAAARLGCEVGLFALNLDSIAMMPCNPCIGGSAKGHLVREIDALGGEMGKAIDASFLQSRMLNATKGPAVYSLRAQADKAKYSAYMKKTLESTSGLYLHQGEIVEIITENGRVTGVRTESDMVTPCDAVICCSGTYLNARCLYGETIVQTGPNGQRASKSLSDSLRSLGFSLMRFKTGTPARVHKRSLDFNKMEEQPGDENLVPFSFETDPAFIRRSQIPCYLTYTNAKTHDIIRASVHRSPMYSGVIEGTGTRYCPSIEDKIVRFADKDRHPVFIEPEGESTDEMYAQGLSSSLPLDVQIEAYRSVPGMENCEIMRPAYAIEYDCIDATRLRLTMEAHDIQGLFFAGQINGSSGYEEAAAQGLMAGINASGLPEPFVIDRGSGYIGVLIDDLVTKGTREPYRMMTSRAEYRLLLRQDNADLRLTEKGYKAGLISPQRYDRFLRKRENIERELERVKKTNIPPSEKVNAFLASKNSALLSTGCKLADLIKRPELTYRELIAVDENRPDNGLGYIGQAVAEQVNIQIKYEGYIDMQIAQAESFRKLEHKKLPAGLNYMAITGLRLEAGQKLNQLKPANVGQASRITGVSPADLNVLLVYLKANPAYGIGE
jgi:tRNA uridine 5-carboxymethylaminomethyl modification enzyme